uniref:Uncharacterized protein n=1 Tax=Brassica oleracea TaxID=3712 RepID=A0A3P6H6D8_BRAOL|nr:unnamed protein product [Brassica oleracea]
MRFLDLQGGGGSSIKKGMIIIILSFLKLTSELILWSSSLICRLATPPPLFKSVCYVFGSLGLSTMVESAWKWICSYWTLRCVIYIRLLLIYRVFHRPESIMILTILVLLLVYSLEPMVSLMRANLGPLSMAFVSTKRR